MFCIIMLAEDASKFNRVTAGRKASSRSINDTDTLVSKQSVLILLLSFFDLREPGAIHRGHSGKAPRELRRG